MILRQIRHKYFNKRRLPNHAALQYKEGTAITIIMNHNNEP